MNTMNHITPHSRICAAINLDAVRHNLKAIQSLLTPHTQIMAVIKTDAYGHGAAEIAKTAEPYEFLYGFAVATAEEALSLRRHGIQKPILILGYVFPEHYQMLAEYEIRPAVFTLDMARQLSQAAKKVGKDLYIHIKIDTGMSRIGLQACEESIQAIAQIHALEHIIIEGIFTHFARADEADKSSAEEQLHLFQNVLRLTEEAGIKIPYRHCSNSAGIISLRDADMDMVRAGIILYGLWPSDEMDKSSIDLKPVLELKSHVAHVKTLPAGRSISYGGTYTLREPGTVATIPAGYGDGYPRSLSNKGYVLIHGRRAPILGRVCMDQFMADVTGIEGVKAGDTVTLAGRDGAEFLSLEQLGEMSGRFNYEFACALGKRIPRVFYENGTAVSERGGFPD